MTTTDLGKRLGVTSQTVRNLRRRIPGARLVGHRLEIERSDRLERWVAEYLRLAPVRRLRRKSGRQTMSLF
jgi:hypothetical protein